MSEWASKKQIGSKNSHNYNPEKKAMLQMEVSLQIQALRSLTAYLKSKIILIFHSM